MIDISSAEAASGVVRVQASDQIFEELGRNTYGFRDLLSELIDNSLAARHPERQLSVRISVFVDETGKPQRFVIRDNASGIPENKFGEAVSPAALQSEGSLNEHGLGMKQAVAALGKLEYLTTKVAGEERARLVKEFRYGDILVFRVPFEDDSGTEISIRNLKTVVRTDPGTYTRTLVPELGARYRRFLNPDDKQLNLGLEIRSFEHPEVVNYSRDVVEVKPIYLHPNTRDNQAVIRRHGLEGPGWAAELTFGYAPTHKEDYDELGLEMPNIFHPYRIALSTQGLDVLFHDRVILFHQLPELGLVPARHNSYNSIRGEIDLKYGFSTAITKNSMIEEEHFAQLTKRVRGILSGEEAGPKGKKRDYLKRVAYPDELPERLLRDRLAKWLKDNPLQSRTEVAKEYGVQGIEGSIDILADGEAWELKTGQATAYDVYQLFMYLDVGSVSKGFLVAQSFTGGAERPHRNTLTQVTAKKYCCGSEISSRSTIRRMKVSAIRTSRAVIS